MSNSTKLEELTAADVKAATGISYRQLNDWDSKGAVSSERASHTGWRKFSTRDVFALLICKEIRDRFGVPVESLRFIRDFMRQDGANHFGVAVGLMSRGLSVWLATDLKEVFEMDSDAEFEDLLCNGWFRGDEASGLMFIRINPLVNRMLACLKKPIQLKVNLEAYAPFQRMPAITAREQQVIDAIRNRQYSQISVSKKGNDEMLLVLTQEIEETKTADLSKLLKASDYQTVTVKRHDGKDTRIIRTETLKLRK